MDAVIDPNGHKKNIHIALLIENESVDEIKKVFFKELEFHGNEGKALCCLKVHIL